VGRSLHRTVLADSSIQPRRSRLASTSGDNDFVTHIAGVFPTDRSDCPGMISTGFNDIVRAEIGSSEGEEKLSKLLAYC
jgi:hypothetical protein